MKKFAQYLGGCLIWIVIISSGNIVSAADLVTTSGEIYKDAAITKATHRGVTVRYESGIVNVPLDELPPDLREKYRSQVEEAKAKWDSEAPLRKKQMQRQKNKELRSKLAAKLPCIKFNYRRGNVYESQTWDCYYDKQRRIHFIGEFIICSQVLSSTSGLFTGGKLGDDTVLITDFPMAGVVDGDKILPAQLKCSKIYLIGKYSYSAVSGAKRTIRKFTASQTAAMRALYPQLFE